MPSFDIEMLTFPEAELNGGVHAYAYPKSGFQFFPYQFPGGMFQLYA